ncbi:MAG TPA: AAA family ATPase [Desulfuromonadales bacterium]|nr:AAA family ATPase [Desulfuromonadales bacterium]
MYIEYFGLKENPFSIAPNPDYLYMSEHHREALAHLLYGLQSDGGFVLLTGEVGTGKTTICRRSIDQVPAEVDLALVLNPKVTVSELLETICDELQISRPENASVKQLVDSLNTRLLETNAQDRKTVLIIDEAQNLSADVLEQLRLLTNLETSRRKLLQIILLGQPELREMIGRPEMRQLAQRVTARYHLAPLARDEVAAYIQHRLQVAGCDRMLFPPSAVKQVSHLSGGVPRLINLVCDRALLGAYARRKSQVDAALVRQAGREVFDLPAPRRMAQVAVLLTTLLLAVAGGYWFAAHDGGFAGLISFSQPEAEVVAETSVEVAAPENGPKGNPSAPAQPAMDLPTTWPGDFGFDNNFATAFADLADLWGLFYPPSQENPCRYAADAGLRCLDRQDNLQSLQGYDRPAVLTLYDDQGRPFHVTLEKLQAQRVRLAAGNTAHELDIAALESRWFGEYQLLWQPPDLYRGPLFPGESGPLVGWLADQLETLRFFAGQGNRVPDRLEGTLLGALKRFQFDQGLTPDGILGPQTMVHLNRALDVPGPRLAFSEVD